MANIVEYFVKGNTAQAAKGLDTLGNKFSSLGRAANGLAANLGIAFGAGGLIAGVKSSLQLADNFEKLERRLGITTEALSELKFAGEQSGVGFNTLTMGLQRMTRRVAEAAQGTGEARGALLELGIDAQKLAALKPEAQFEVIAQAMSEVTTEGDRTRLAMKLFDSEGVALLQTMTDGANGIRELRGEARELGLTMSQESAAGAAEALDAMNRLKSAMAGLSQESAINLAPALTDLANTAAQQLPAAMQFASNAFNMWRKAAFTSISFVFEKLGVFMSALADYSAKLNGDLLFGDGFTQRLQNSATTLENFGLAMKGRAADIEITTGTFEKQATVLREVHGPAIEEVASKYGKLTAQEAKLAIEAENAAAKMALLADDDLMKRIGEGLKVNIGDQSANIFEQMRDGFKSTLLNMANDILNSSLQSAFKSVFNLGGGGGSGSGGGGGIFGAVKSIFGFNDGGAFTVPSFGTNAGIDKSLVSIAASPGEVVSVTPANQARGRSPGGNTVINNTYRFEGQSAPDRAELKQFMDMRDAKLKGEIMQNLRGRA